MVSNAFRVSSFSRKMQLAICLTCEQLLKWLANIFRGGEEGDDGDGGNRLPVRRRGKFFQQLLPQLFLSWPSFFFPFSFIPSSFLKITYIFNLFSRILPRKKHLLNLDSSLQPDSAPTPPSHLSSQTRGSHSSSTHLEWQRRQRVSGGREAESFSEDPYLKYHLDIFLIFLLICLTGNLIASSSSSHTTENRKPAAWRSPFVRAWSIISDKNGKANQPVF